MRHLSFVLCASVAVCGYAPLTHAGTTSPLTFTLDLQAPCGPSGCTGTHPTDVNLDAVASAFSYANGTGSASGSFVANMSMNQPVVCDEIATGGGLGAITPLRIAPAYTNASPGALLEFNAGGPSIVDLTAMTFDGESPAGFAATYGNGASAPQVLCYQINPISGGAVALAPGPTGIYTNGFDVLTGHFSSEPWLSVQTVTSPAAGAGKSQQKAAGGQINGITPTNSMAYVIQVHNASTALGWHLDLGYDFAFFDPANNGETLPQWCILLPPSVPQPGPLTGSASCSNVTSTHTFAAADIPAGSNSIYIYVQNSGSSTATASWNSLTSSFYPAVAAIFPVFGTYPQRLDDKVAVASANNLPTQNIGSIVCNNDQVSTACTIADPDGHAVPAQLTFTNAITGGGVATIDPLAYFVDPTGGTTLPGNASGDALNASNVSCQDPSGILASSLGNGNVGPSVGALGALSVGFGFASSGSPNFPYVAGTAFCTVTYSAANFAPVLASTGSFTITMQQAAVGNIGVTAPAGTAAPAGNLIYTVVVSNAGNSALANVAVTDNQTDATFTVNSWTCTGTGVSCPHSSGAGTLGETIPSMPVGSSLTYSVSGTVGAIGTNPVTAVTNTASISVPHGSCAAGLCSHSASVATVPIIGVVKNSSEQTYHTADPVTYTVALSNQGGTLATGLSLADAVPSGIAFVSWTCAASGTMSSCPHAVGGSVDINESPIAIDVGGSVTYTVLATVTSTGGTVTNTATVSGLSGGAVCGASNCSASAPMSLGP